jgi:hypothetical protein
MPGAMLRRHHEHRVHGLVLQGVARGQATEVRQGHRLGRHAQLRQQAAQHGAVATALGTGRHPQTGQLHQRGQRRVAAEQPQHLDVHAGQRLHRGHVFGVTGRGRPAKAALDKRQIGHGWVRLQALEVVGRTRGLQHGQLNAAPRESFRVPGGVALVGTVNLPGADGQARGRHRVEPPPGHDGQRHRRQCQRQADQDPAVTVERGGGHGLGLKTSSA